MDIHQCVAYSMILVVLTRLVWGLIGTDAARSAHFLAGSSWVCCYLKRRGHFWGQTPLRTFSVWVFILLLAQSVSGTKSSDGLLPFEGLFSYWAGG